MTLVVATIAIIINKNALWPYWNDDAKEATVENVPVFTDAADEFIYENAYGIDIIFTGMEDWLKSYRDIPAKHKADVRVEYQGETKEYTFKEFFDRLGFKQR